MHLLLVGLRGSGKTTIGRTLANLGPTPFIDLDDRTATLAGQSARECFMQHGEARWRELESTAIDQALDEESSIIALGGGTPTSPGALTRIQRAQTEGIARVVWLDAPDEILLKRIGEDPGRPALTNLSPAEEMAEIRTQREPIYSQIAQERLDTASMPMDELLGRLAEFLR